jgi:two-component system sensor histidine kinase CpxA
MRSLAIKIFLSFWIAQVVILVGLEIFRPRPSIAAPPLRPPGSSPFFIPTPVLVAAIVVSAIVCFLLARNLAAPLRRVREASDRLASGDLLARAGSMVRPRRDEIGDLVRDFDAMAERLYLLVSSQKQLLSDISHELRSPLARLQVAVELARRKAGPDAEKHLNRIEAEGTRMNEMIGQILTLARADSDRPAVSEEIDLAEIVKSVVTDTDYEARQTGREVRVRNSQRAMVLGDAALLASAVENVVRNGSRYTPPGTSVDVSLDVTPTHGRIVVRDHGPGVPPGETERIFLPFHRVSLSRDRDSGGAGLGLSIAARAVKVHGGSIRAVNAEGGGLEVSIDIPLYKALHRLSVS